MFATKFLLLLFVCYAHGHGYVAVPHSRVSRCFLGNGRVSGIWNGGTTGDRGCDAAFQDARSRGVDATAQFTSRMAYVGRNTGGLRTAFENGSLLSNTEVCSAGSQATYHHSGDFRSMDNAFNWYLNPMSRSAGKYTDVRLQFCATAPHHTNRWFIYHFKEDPRYVPVTWDKLTFVQELPTQPLITSTSPLSSCFTHDIPHNSFYELNVPVDLQDTGTIVVVQQNDAFFSWEFNINCVDYVAHKIGKQLPQPQQSIGCEIPQCVVGNDLILPDTDPRHFWFCKGGLQIKHTCEANRYWTIQNACMTLPIHETSRFPCQDWSSVGAFQEQHREL